MAILAAIMLSPGAAACAVCDSENGRQVRAGVFDDEFGWTLVKVASPFPVLLGAVGVLYLLMPETAGKREGADGR